MKVVIDSCVFISAMGTKDAFTKASRELFERFSGNQSIAPIISMLTVVEVLVTLKKQNYIYLQHAYTLLLELDTRELDSELVETSFDLLSEASKIQMKSSDFIISTLACKEDATLLTWDKQLIKNARVFCQAQTPLDFMRML